MIHHLKYWLFFLFLLSNFPLSGQNYTVHYRLLDNEDGLLGSGVRAYHQDQNGFIWMATQRGISRFDGHQFQWFTEVNSNLRGLPEKNAFVQDDEGNLWSVALDKIDVINPKTLEIQPLEKKLGYDLPFKESIYHIRQSEDNHIFFRTMISERWFHYHSSIGFQEISFLNHQANEKALQIKGQKLWFYSRDTDSRAICYDFASGEKIREVKVTESSKLRPILNYSGERDLFWAVHPNILQIVESTESGTKVIAEFEGKNSMKMGSLFVAFLPKMNLFITNFNYPKNGFSVIDLENQQLISIKNTQSDDFMNFRLSWVSSEDILWGNSGRNVLFFNLKKSKFQQLATNEPHRGLQIFDNYLFTKKTKISLKNYQKAEERSRKGFVVGVDPYQKNEFWVGNSNAVSKINPATNEVEKTFFSRFKSPRFWTLLKTEENQIWVGSYYRGLFKIVEDSIRPYSKVNEFEELHQIRINHLLKDGDYVWATSPLGLYLIHKNRGALQKYNSEASSAFYLPVNHAHFLHKDANGIYWLATSSEGLIRFTLNENFEVTTLKKYAVDDGLSSNVLYCILEDDSERLWISTLNGISCLDKKTETIRTFHKEDGIEELEFNRNSFTKTDDGRLFFGSIDGVTAFYPDEVIEKDNYDLPLYLTKVLAYDKNEKKWINQTEGIKATEEIILQPENRFLKMNVAMLDVLNSPKIHYDYKIEGLFDNFQPIEGNTIEIGGLPYGTYTLKVRAQGRDQRFSEQELAIPLQVVPPFYLCRWFITLVVTLLIFGAIQFYFWRIKKLNQEQKALEKLVKERTAQIEKDKTVIEAQAQQLKELDEVKSRFFANISHELRTPLTLILNPIARLLQRNELTNKDLTSLKLMEQNGQKLLKRINELLDLSRLDANKIKVQETPTFLYPLLRNILAAVDSAANAKEILLLFEYDLSQDLQILLDTDKVEKILFNFLSNALKFTPKEGKITIRAERVQQQLQISVSDTGTGILPEETEKVFDRFYQSAHSKSAQGTGIGLALCRELATVLDGKVWAESTFGEGSIFYVQLPLVETFVVKEKTPLLLPEEEELFSPAPVKNNKNSKILVVEDNPDLRNYLTEILQDNYQVQTAEHGREALDWLNKPNQSAPNLIISDIMMPVMDGIELLSNVKKHKQLQHIPMVMLTARQSMEIKLEALCIGVDDYLVKPFNEAELLTRVENLIKNTQNRLSADSSNTKNAPDISKTDLNWLKKVEAIILENIAAPNFMLKEIAPKMSLSYNGFQQKIKKITGLSPKKYERSIKLNRARAILKGGEVETVSEVLYQLGFDNHYYFSKIYRQEFGVMPSEELK